MAITRKNIERDLDEMTMSQIKVYVEELKSIIYRQAELMETVNASFKLVESGLKEFSGVKQPIKTVSKPIVEEPTKEVIEESIEENDSANWEIDNDDYSPVDYIEESKTDTDMTYVLNFEFNPSKNDDEWIDNAVVGFNGKKLYYISQNNSPDYWRELTERVEHAPHFFFHHILYPEEVADIWQKFCKEIGVDLDDANLITAALIDENKVKKIIQI